MLHAFSSETDYHLKYPDAIRFGYHDGGQHAYNPAIEPRSVIIGTASFVDDVIHAVKKFVNHCRSNSDLLDPVPRRLPAVLATIPVSQNSL